MTQSVYDAAGGRQAFLDLAHAWHERCLADPVVSHAFSHGVHPQHTERLAAYWAEALGGPPDYTDSLGDESMVVRMHSGNGEHDEMDERAQTCFALALDDAGLPDDPRLRATIEAYFRWATEAMATYPESAGEVPAGLALPRWSWDGPVLTHGRGGRPWARNRTEGNMPQEFEGDLAGAVFWGADLTGARFRDVILTGATISHAELVNVDIDALVDNLVINGVDVTDYVNERDPWYPLRSLLRAPDPEGMRAAWAALEGEWSKTISRACALPEDRLHESINGEFSFVQTLRHLVFCIDKWFTAPILGGSFHPIGLPNRGSVDFPWPGLDYGLTPSITDVLAVRADRATSFRDYLGSVAPTEFTRSIDVLENGSVPFQECIYTVFEEEFSHNRYALRDLALLEAAQ